MAQLVIIDALVRYLVTVTALTDLLSKGTNNTPSIRPGSVKQGTDVPYITILKIADNPDQVLSGVTNFTTRTFNIKIVSDSVLTNAKIAEQLRQNLDGYQRRLLPPNLTEDEGAIWVNSIRKSNDFDFPNIPQTGDQYVKYETNEIYDIGVPLDDNVVHPPLTTI